MRPGRQRYYPDGGSEEEYQGADGQLKSSASEANQSLDDYIAKNFGDYCTAATLETVQEQAYIAENYYRHTLTRSNISDAEYNAFYKAHSKDITTAPLPLLR